MSDIPNKDQQDLESIVTEAMAEENLNPKSEPEKKGLTGFQLIDPKYKIPRIVFLSLVGIVALFSLVFLIYVSTDLPPMDLIENPDSDLSTQLISADGEVLQKYYSRENRVNVKLNQVSEHVVNALIATEDARFYGHSGVDPKSFFSILVGYLRSREVRGGSTITMQLSRNLYDEVGQQNSTLVRKVKEYLVSAYIERRFTKQEIMEAYLNTVNIYGTSYGIETTANRLFDKTAKDLTVEEAAMIVGMLKGQGVYNPFRYPERTQNRRNTILDQMVKYGVLDGEKINVDSIKQIPITSALTDQEQVHIKGLAPYFREYVRSELTKWCNSHKKEDGSTYNIYTDGLRVYTTLDSRMQKHAEAAVREHMTQLQKDFDRVEAKGSRILDKDPSILLDIKRTSDRYIRARKAGKSDTDIEKEFRKKVPMTVFSWDGPIDTMMTPYDSLRYYVRLLETGMISIDPTNGHVKAWVGGIDYKYFKYDHVAKSRRQVGSTFKPFVYGAAVEAGFKPCDIELNQPVVFENPGGQRWVPKNSGGEIGGKMTLKHALANSVNLVTARLMKKLGPHTVATFAHRMGIKTELDEVPSLCLGTTDLTVMELTSAYSTFANYGNQIDPIMITRIEDRSGNVLASFEPQPKKEISAEDAYLIIELLKGVVNQGTAQRLRFRYDFKNEIGGKTGTTQNQSDGWFMGVTPNLVTGVWVGGSDRRIRFRSISYGQGANMALPVWALYMKAVYADGQIGLPAESFERPAGLNVNLNCGAVIQEEQQDQQQAPGADDFDDFN
ncbi:MAG: PBP1A family penicillin-binding protein [Bacteroidetes bacterium]|nr:PBP1A family penicillin-binding protein [Bacteroidota bacterium]